MVKLCGSIPFSFEDVALLALAILCVAFDVDFVSLCTTAQILQTLQKKQCFLSNSSDCYLFPLACVSF